MNFWNGFNTLHFLNWFLVTVRLGAAFQGTPFFGSNAIPVFARGFIVCACSYYVYALPHVQPLTDIPEAWDLISIMVKEIAVGGGVRVFLFHDLFAFKGSGNDDWALGGVWARPSHQSGRRGNFHHFAASFRPIGNNNFEDHQ